ncbi:MAG: hypothetical protein Q9176_000917 [Flavoplaca citrina]
MNWTVTAAVEHDADRIADVHMAAFGSNALLLAQFPTRDVRTQLRDCIAKKAADDIRDPYIAVLVVHDQDKIVSFAKWSLPITASEAYVEEPWAWPDGTNFHVLREWTGKVEEAQQRILGELPSYRLSFIGTDPQYERRGAATALMKWGLDRCCTSNVPAYLESTLKAVPFYERLGFKTMCRVIISLDESMAYEEACCLYEPCIEKITIEK